MKNLDLSYPHAFDHPWDNIEIERMQWDGENDVTRIYDKADEKDDDFWSVYVHQEDGGAMCIADLPTEKDADDLRVLLSKAVKMFKNNGYLSLYDNKHLQEEFNKQLDNALDYFDPNNLGHSIVSGLKTSFNNLFI
jgi:hypothetical protein